MHTLNMKIVGYDEDSQSLLVSFASNETLSDNPDDYAPIAFQPSTMWPELTDMDEVIKRIALSGIGHLNYITAKEQFTADSARVKAMQELVGQSISYAMDDLITPVVVTPFQTV
jgi:hypothetical protein